jgi:hypothetical protein
MVGTSLLVGHVGVSAVGSGAAQVVGDIGEGAGSAVKDVGGIARALSPDATKPNGAQAG